MAGVERVREAGASISLPDARKWNRGGLDTVALTWRGQGGSRLLSELVGHPETVPMARGRMFLGSPASGLRVMAWPQFGVVKGECRLAALLDGSSDSHRLADRDELRHADGVMRSQIRGLVGEAPEGGPPGVSRFDLTTEREFDAAEGQAVLKAMRAICPTGFVKEATTQADGVVRAVAVKTARGHRTVFRAYDKGLESSSHQAGERVRLEAQCRARSDQRMAPTELAAADLRRQFGRVIDPFLRGDPIVVTNAAGVTEQLVAKVAAGDLSIRRAEGLIGAAEVLRHFGRAIYADDRKSWRRLKALRDAGVAVDEELPPDAVIPVSELLRQAVEEFNA